MPEAAPFRIVTKGWAARHERFALNQSVRGNSSRLAVASPTAVNFFGETTDLLENEPPAPSDRYCLRCDTPRW